MICTQERIFSFIYLRGWSRRGRKVSAMKSNLVIIEGLLGALWNLHGIHNRRGPFQAHNPCHSHTHHWQTEQTWSSPGEVQRLWCALHRSGLQQLLYRSFWDQLEKNKTKRQIITHMLNSWNVIMYAEYQQSWFQIKTKLKTETAFLKMQAVIQVGQL